MSSVARSTRTQRAVSPSAKRPRKRPAQAAGKQAASALTATDAATLQIADDKITAKAVVIHPGEMATFLQEHLGQKLTAYIAGQKDAKAVGQWAKGRAVPSAIVCERLRAAYQVTSLFDATYGDRAASGWFFGANSALDEQAPAAVLRTAETPDEIARVVPLARAFIRSAL